ncbi:MAG: cytochrome bd-I oxidase subunit CydX [Steroidobacteraceae bacterium]
MWYFSWVLGTGLALAFGVLNAIWYEVTEGSPEQRPDQEPPAARTSDR